LPVTTPRGLLTSGFNKPTVNSDEKLIIAQHQAETMAEVAAFKTAWNQN
jgi:hypothetical protein